jgi:hypothetical protein
MSSFFLILTSRTSFILSMFLLLLFEDNRLDPKQDERFVKLKVRSRKRSESTSNCRMRKSATVLGQVAVAVEDRRKAANQSSNRVPNKDVRKQINFDQGKRENKRLANSGKAKIPGNN